jgi:citrate lyase subunit beta/citryl-CoA lyase
MANVEAIAQSSRRLEAMHFGVADYAASCRARTVSIGGLNPDYPGDQWHAALSRMVVACRAYGLRAIDGPFGDFKDPEGYILGAKRGAALGIEGKWAIHPSQIALANEVFTPPPAEVERAKRILTALEEAAREGRGAAQLDGRMIDAASARMAQNVVEMAEAIGRTAGRRPGGTADGSGHRLAAAAAATEPASAVPPSRRPAVVHAVRISTLTSRSISRRSISAGQ